MHRYGVFRRGDGTAAHYGSLAWVGSPTLPTPSPVSSPKGTADDFYIVSMDDAPNHWLRLVAEDIAPGGSVETLRHSGGRPHPDHSHLYLGGTFAWSSGPSAAVQEAHRGLAALSLGDLIARAHGPIYEGHLT